MADNSQNRAQRSRNRVSLRESMTLKLAEKRIQALECRVKQLEGRLPYSDTSKAKQSGQTHRSMAEAFEPRPVIWTEYNK